MNILKAISSIMKHMNNQGEDEMSIISYIDCRGEMATLDCESFTIEIDENGYTLFWISLGLESVELVITGRYQGKKIEDLFVYD